MNRPLIAMNIRQLIIVSLLSSLGMVGCSSQKPQGNPADSASQASYVSQVPEPTPSGVMVPQHAGSRERWLCQVEEGIHNMACQISQAAAVPRQTEDGITQWGKP